MLIGGGGFTPVRELRAAGSPVGLGCDGELTLPGVEDILARHAVVARRLQGLA